jgi:hypothetical protein
MQYDAKEFVPDNTCLMALRLAQNKSAKRTKLGSTRKKEQETIDSSMQRCIRQG